MDRKLFITANDVADMMGVSKSRAYRIIRDLNRELSERGYVTVAGRVSRKFFEEKVYGMAG